MARAHAGATTLMTGGPALGARSVAVLAVLSGPDAGRILSLPISSSITIGRADECTATLSDASLSRMHARVDCVLGEFVLTDMGSRNGSYVNDAPVTGPVRLREGDRVTLGRATSMRFALVTAEEEAAMRAVYEASTRDALTGVWNRRATDERTANELAAAIRHGMPLSVVLVDIDHFKRVNDTLGHAAGDAVLTSTASVLARSVRAEDFVGRVGGEEFLILLRATPLGGAHTAAERLRGAIEGSLVPVAGRMTRVTASFGVASLACAGGSGDRTVLLALADARLYEAKRRGRNRVVAEGGFGGGA